MRITSQGSWRLRAALLSGLVLVAVVAGGIAWATIPENGVYTGCYLKSGGTLRVIDASQKCKTTETRITWNQQGQPGEPGQRGEQGEQGPPGPTAITQNKDWCGGDGCPNMLHFTNADVGVQHQLLTLQKPPGGYWDKAVVVATINFVNTSNEPVQVNCGSDAGASGVYTIPADTGHGAGIQTVTFTGSWGTHQGDAHLGFSIFAPGPSQVVDLGVGWASLTLIPATQS